MIHKCKSLNLYCPKIQYIVFTFMRTRLLTHITSFYRHELVLILIGAMQGRCIQRDARCDADWTLEKCDQGSLAFVFQGAQLFHFCGRD